MNVRFELKEETAKDDNLDIIFLDSQKDLVLDSQDTGSRTDATYNGKPFADFYKGISEANEMKKECAHQRKLERKDKTFNQAKEIILLIGKTLLAISWVIFSIVHFIKWWGNPLRDIVIICILGVVLESYFKGDILKWILKFLHYLK